MGRKGGKERGKIYLNLKDKNRKWTLEILNVFLVWNTSPNARSGTTISLSFLVRGGNGFKWKPYWLFKMDSSRWAKRTVFLMTDLKGRSVPAGRAALQLWSLPRPDSWPLVWLSLWGAWPHLRPSTPFESHPVAGAQRWTGRAQLIFAKFVCICIHN